MLVAGLAVMHILLETEYVPRQEELKQKHGEAFGEKCGFLVGSKGRRETDLIGFGLGRP